MRRLNWIILTLLAGLLIHGTAFATNFPQRIMVVLRQKASCRDAKRLVRKNRLFVHCTPNSPFARSFEADYLGSEPLPALLQEVAQYSKVQEAAPVIDN